jgi:hypothetical protein
MKYIIFEDQAGRAVPIIFPDKIGHAEMREQMPYGTVLSCGYVELDADRRFLCHGDCQELGARSAEQDAEKIAAAFGREEW